MDVQSFDFELPESLIAQSPLQERTTSRLLCLNKRNGDIAHRSFRDLIDYVNAGDTLILNDTKVIPARLFGSKPDTGAKVEVLLLRNIGQDRWETLVRPARKCKKGAVIHFGADRASGSPLMRATVLSESDQGGRILQFEYQGIFHALLDQLGHMPLPPYIKEQLEEKDRYQTVYAKHVGSVAAPTAGLHFTNDYLQQLAQKGVNIAYITLHVGLGTFRPVTVERVEDHQMHAEYYHLPEETAEIIRKTRRYGGRIIAVGTTSARTLETVAQRYKGSSIQACSGWTDLFIYPGYTFQLVDALLTNFHLPKSTLLMLISAFADRETILEAYRQAIERKYRFFSFGDAMFIY